MSKLIEVDQYSLLLNKMLIEIELEEADAISRAAAIIYKAFAAGGILHVFATGHSHMIADELFYRSGGLAPVNPILCREMMVYEGAVQSTLWERQPGNAGKTMARHDLQPLDSMLLSSNSGINVVIIEAAELARRMGLSVIGVTSVKASGQLESRHPSGKKLYDLCDVVIDNHAPAGDGLLEIPGSGQVTGGASTFGSLYIAQRIALSIENHYLENGEMPPIFRSANLPGGDAYNETLLDRYKKRIPPLGM